MIALDVQLLLGFGLYAGPSPATAAAFANVGAAMKDPTLRFWLVEHTSLMILAVVFGHVGNIRVRKLAEDAAKHRAAAIFFGLSVLCIALAMPWPFRAAIGRPWLPGF
jgi:phosphatidylserine synthase